MTVPIPTDNARLAALYEVSQALGSSLQLEEVLNIVMDSAKAYRLSLPTSALNTQLFAALIAAGQGELDNSAVIGVIEELAGTKLETGD